MKKTKKVINNLDKAQLDPKKFWSWADAEPRSRAKYIDSIYKNVLGKGCKIEKVVHTDFGIVLRIYRSKGWWPFRKKIGEQDFIFMDWEALFNRMND